MQNSLSLSTNMSLSLAESEKVSTVKELAENLHVSEQTVKNAIYELRQLLSGVFENVKKNSQGGYLLTYEQATAIKLKLRERNNLKDSSVVSQIGNDLEFFALLKKREKEQQILDAYRDRRIAELTAENNQLQSKNDLLMHTQKTYTASEIAKELGLTSAQKLNQILKEKEIQYYRNGTWLPTSKYSDKEYYEIKQDVLDNGIVIYNSRFTQKGRDFILSLKEKGVI